MGNGYRCNSTVDGSFGLLVWLAVRRSNCAENLVEGTSASNVDTFKLSGDVHLNQNVIAIEQKFLPIVIPQNSGGFGGFEPSTFLDVRTWRESFCILNLGKSHPELKILEAGNARCDANSGRKRHRQRKKQHRCLVHLKSGPQSKICPP